jgi:hypothetical protein
MQWSALSSGRLSNNETYNKYVILHCLVKSIYYLNTGTSSLVSDIDHYIILNVLLVFTHWWEVQTLWVNTYVARWQRGCVDDIQY